MKPIYQDKFGEEGNCFEACMASILEIPLQGVPAFMANNWILNADRWLKEKYSLGLLAITIPKLFPDDGVLMILFRMGVYYIQCGQSPRSLLHSCVAYSGKIVHDPHPQGGGLQKEEESYFFVRL